MSRSGLPGLRINSTNRGLQTLRDDRGSKGRVHGAACRAQEVGEGI